MANEITEIGQIVTYGGTQLTLAGSDLASKINSLLVREGSGSGRGWRLFDSAQAAFLNTKTVLNPGDVVLVNAKSVPMDFPVQASGSGGGSLSYPFAVNDNGPTSEIDGNIDVSQAYLPSFSFSSGSGTLQMRIDGGSWGATGLVTIGKTAEFRILHTAPFSGTLTLTAQ